MPRPQCKRDDERKARQNRARRSGVRNFFVYNFFRMLRFLTAGESHGQALVITLDGMPAGLELDIDALNAQLRRRQGGYGRGRRMAIESDRAEILAGVRHGRTTGAPIALLIRNRDWVNWQQTMYVEREMPEARVRNQAARRHAAAARPRRPRRRDQVRPRRHPRRARARQRPRDGVPRRRRLAGAPAARPVRHPHRQPRVGHRRRRASGRPRTVSFDEAQAHRRRRAASLRRRRTSSSR